MRMTPPRFGCPLSAAGVCPGVSPPSFLLPPHAAASPTPAAAAAPVKNLRRDSLLLYTVTSHQRGARCFTGLVPVNGSSQKNTLARPHRRRFGSHSVPRGVKRLYWRRGVRVSVHLLRAVCVSAPLLLRPSLFATGHSPATGLVGHQRVEAACHRSFRYRPNGRRGTIR